MAIGSTLPSLADKPWAPIAIPLGVVAGLAVIAVGVHYLLRRRYKSRLAVSSDPRVRQALERDLQEAWVRGATANDRTRQQQSPTSPNRSNHPRSQQQQQQRGGGARWVRPATTRWAWARDMMQARAEEGLNELGEAPPPYDGRTKRDKLLDEGDGDVERGRGGPGDVELGPLAPDSSPSGPHPPPPPLDGRSEPPAYGEQQPPADDTREARAAVTRPPAALLSSVHVA